MLALLDFCGQTGTNPYSADTQIYSEMRDLFCCKIDPVVISSFARPFSLFQIISTSGKCWPRSRTENRTEIVPREAGQDNNFLESAGENKEKRREVSLWNKKSCQKGKKLISSRIRRKFFLLAPVTSTLIRILFSRERHNILNQTETITFRY